MPPERQEEGLEGGGSGSKGQNKTPTLRPPLYNAEDYIGSLRQLFSHHKYSLATHTQNANGQPSGPSSVLIEHATNGPLYSNTHNQQPEMGMKKFLNGSELLFKLEADLRHAFPSFVQEFVTGQFEGVGSLLEALKTIQAALEDVSALREQRKMLMDEQKCLQCIKLTLRNIESVSKLASYPGGLYPLAAASVSTVTATRIIAFEVLTCVCCEGGADGHYKVSEALSTLRLRVGEPIRCKLIVGAVTSAPPGTFQAKGIKFLTSFIASAPSPKHKVHIQCELEEAGLNASVLRKGAELGGARESREVHVELDEWERVIIDVDTLTRQNCQLRNSVATLQQELATLKDKLKRMDTTPQQSSHHGKRASGTSGMDGKRGLGKSSEAMITTPVDSEEEAEQIHQILEDLNNIVNSEMRHQNKVNGERGEKEIVPVHLTKSPPKKKLSSSTPHLLRPRPWPGSSASDDDDSDIVEMMGGGVCTKNVKKVVQQLENMEGSNSPPLHFKEKHQKLQNLPISMSKPTNNNGPPTEPRVDYSVPNFHKANHMASKFANFKSSKLYSSSPENCGGGGGGGSSGGSRSSSKNNVSSGYAEVYEKSSRGSDKYNNSPPPPRFSPNLHSPKSHHHHSYFSPTSGGLRRSESLHASLASIEVSPGGGSGKDRKGHASYVPQHKVSPNKGHGADHGKGKGDKWKSMESLGLSEAGRASRSSDENFTLRWKYPQPDSRNKDHASSSSATPSPKSGNNSKVSKNKSKNNGAGPGEQLVVCQDYRQSRFTKHQSNNIPSNPVTSSSNTSSPLNIFSRYTKKSSDKEKDKHVQNKGYMMNPSSHPAPHPQQQLIPGLHHNDFHLHPHHHQQQAPPNGGGHGGKENMKMFSLPPIMMPHALDNHRLTDLPSGLY